MRARTVAACLCAAATLTTSAAARLPTSAAATLSRPAAAGRSSSAGAAGPSIRAPSGIVVDAATGQTLYARRPDSRRPIASTTKMMTALVAVERGREGELIASRGYAPGPEEVTIGLVPGER